MLMQNDIAATASTGFTLVTPRFDPVERQAELDAVVAFANQRRRGLKRLSEFSIAPVRADDDYSYFTQIRAVPVTGFRGCEFRFDMPARQLFETSVEERVDRLLKAAAAFCRLRNLKKYIELAREMVERAIHPAVGRLNAVRLAAIGITIDRDGADFSLVVDIEMLGDDLTPGAERVRGHDIEAVEEKLTALVESHLNRDKLRNLATASRAIGWIDQTVLNVIAAAGISRADALAMVKERGSAEFYFGGEEGYEFTASLYWDDGVVACTVDPALGWTYGGGRLTMLKPAVPETVLAAWPGRRLGAIVDHPFIPGDALVTHVMESGEWLYVDIVTATHVLHEESLMAGGTPPA